MFTRVGSAAYKTGLGNIEALCETLGNPERKFKSIHVAGRNGKGSSSHLLASVLMEAGYKTGLFTSPHLKDFRERIRINGKEIPKRTVTAFVNTHKDFLEAQKLSFFEMTVGMAFDYFANEKVDIAVIEVGLGGRLDSTNIITPLVSVITNIGYDHMQFLGETLPEIAGEKAGIIKEHIPVVIGEYQDEVASVFLKKAAEMKASIQFASEDTTMYTSDLLGDYQQSNTKTAVAAIKKLPGFLVSDENIKVGLQNVVNNTQLKGRWQILQQHTTVICDTAHNKEGLQIALNQLVRQEYEILHIVLGVVSDKKVADIFPFFPKNAQYYFCKPNIPRGLSEVVLQQQAATFGLQGKTFLSVKKALNAALKSANQQDIIYVGGSTFVVAEVV
jgi:dihydrofolate synthase/folylpolyglutamate synthase